eukprot:Gb_17012 [translate_table: standard]
MYLILCLWILDAEFSFSVNVWRWDVTADILKWQPKMLVSLNVAGLLAASPILKRPAAGQHISCYQQDNFTPAMSLEEGMNRTVPLSTGQHTSVNIVVGYIQSSNEPMFGKGTSAGLVCLYIYLSSESYAMEGSGRIVHVTNSCKQIIQQFVHCAIIDYLSLRLAACNAATGCLSPLLAIVLLPLQPASKALALSLGCGLLFTGTECIALLSAPIFPGVKSWLGRTNSLTNDNFRLVFHPSAIFLLRELLGFIGNGLSLLIYYTII